VVEGVREVVEVVESQEVGEGVRVAGEGVEPPGVALPDRHTEIEWEVEGVREGVCVEEREVAEEGEAAGERGESV